MDLQKNYRNSTLGEVFDLYKKDLYKDGFLFKPIKSVHLDTNVTPTIDELKNFQIHISEDGVVPLPSKQSSVTVGDTIRVVDGNLKDITGVVVDVKDGVVSLRSNLQGWEEILHESLASVRKYVKDGDSVLVVDGRHKGEAGLVTSVENEVVTIFSHLSEQCFTLRMDDVKVSTAGATQRTKLGKYMLHDLVSVGQNAIGVIVKVDADSFCILETTGLVKKVTPSEVNDKRLSATSFDRTHNQITANDEVTVVEGTHKGREGTVKYVIRHHLFVHSPGMIEWGGIFVVRSSFVVSSRDRMQIARPTSNNFAPHSPFIGGDSDRGQRGRGSSRGRGIGGGRGGRNDPLLGKKVKVTKGAYKGYMALVRECTEKNVRVELISKSKIVSILREDIAEAAEQNNFDRYRHLGTGATPMLGDRTPMMGDRTPMMGDRTPMMGDRTPMMGDRTPMRGDRTPGESWDDSESPHSGFSSWSNMDFSRDGPSFNPVATPSAYDTTSPYGQIGTPNDTVSHSFCSPRHSHFSFFRVPILRHLGHSIPVHLAFPIPVHPAFPIPVHPDRLIPVPLGIPLRRSPIPALQDLPIPAPLWAPRIPVLQGLPIPVHQDSLIPVRLDTPIPAHLWDSPIQELPDNLIPVHLDLLTRAHQVCPIPVHQAFPIPALLDSPTPVPLVRPTPVLQASLLKHLLRTVVSSHKVSRRAMTYCASYFSNVH